MHHVAETADIFCLLSRPMKMISDISESSHCTLSIRRRIISLFGRLWSVGGGAEEDVCEYGVKVGGS